MTTAAEQARLDAIHPYSFIRDDEPGYLESQTGGTTRMVISVLHVAKAVGLLPHTHRSET